MLQKGFLKSQTKKEPKTSAAKTSRLLLFLGVIIVLSAIFYMMTNIQQADTFMNVWLSAMIAGFCLVFISIWMSFFARYKKRQSKL